MRLQPIAGVLDLLGGEYSGRPGLALYFLVTSFVAFRQISFGTFLTVVSYRILGVSHSTGTSNSHLQSKVIAFVAYDFVWIGG